jgi:hypothetical protein
VRSELELHGAIPAGGGEAPADVTVRYGDVPHELAGGTAIGPNWIIADDRALVRVPAVARFLISAGREIVVALEPGVPEDEAIVFLLGAAFGVLQHQRQRMMLHASAVAVGDKAVLFAGPSGAGKSTLAVSLNQRGYPCVSDDVCGIDFSSGAPVVLPDGRMLKLWADTVAHFEVGERQGRAIRKHLDKYYVEPEKTAVDRKLAVAAVYVLRRVSPNTPDPGITRLGKADAAVLLRRNAYRPSLIRKTGLEGAYFAWSSALQKQAGVYALNRPFDFGAAAQVIGWLEDHWRSLGLASQAA